MSVHRRRDRRIVRGTAVLPRRILIAGASGAGKSTLARELSRRTSLPYTELDSLFHGPGWTRLATFESAVRAITASDGWVSEWQYTSVRALLLDRAELLVCLDYSRWVVMRRVVRRTIGRRIRRTEIWNGNVEPPLRTFFSDPDHIVRWSWSTFRSNRTVMRALAADPPPGCRVVRLTSPRATRRWLAQHSV